MKGNVVRNGRCADPRMFMKMFLKQSRFSGEFLIKTHFLFPHRDKRERHLTTTVARYECAKGARHGNGAKLAGSEKVRLVIADVDGKLVTQEKVPAERNSEAYFYELLP